MLATAAPRVVRLITCWTPWMPAANRHCGPTIRSPRSLKRPSAGLHKIGLERDFGLRISDCELNNAGPQIRSPQPEIRNLVMLIGEPPPTQADLHFRLLGFPVRIHPFFWVTTLILGMGGGPA